MIIKKNLGLINKKNRINLTIGTFDAFHKGHLKILNTLIKTSKQDKAKSCVITFQNRPKHFLKQKSNGIILSNKDRIIFFKKFKINYLFYLEFTKKFACITAEDFIYKLINLFNVNKIIIGNDFKFGYGNKGNVTTL